MKKIEEIERIDKYLREELSPEEQREFEKQMQSDLKFKSRVREFELFAEGIRRTGATTSQEEKLDILRSTLTPQMLDGMEEKEDRKPGRVIPLKVVRRAVVAAAAVVLAIVVFPFLFQQQMTGEEIFVEHFAVHPYLFQQVRGEESTGSKTLETAFSAYQSGRYEDAITLFNEALNAEDLETGSSAEARLCLANSYLKVGKTPEARTELLTLTENTTLSISKEVKWYLALTYIRLGNSEEGERLLEELTGRTGRLKKMAEEVLKDLK